MGENWKPRDCGGKTVVGHNGQNHSSRLIALPNFAYNTALSFCISFSHSPILPDISEICDSKEDLSFSTRFNARSCGTRRNDSPILYLVVVQYSSRSEKASKTHITSSSSSPNSSSTKRSSNASFSCCEKGQPHAAVINLVTSSAPLLLGVFRPGSALASSALRKYLSAADHLREDKS